MSPIDTNAIAARSGLLSSLTLIEPEKKQRKENSEWGFSLPLPSLKEAWVLKGKREKWGRGIKNNEAMFFYKTAIRLSVVCSFICLWFP